MHFVSCHRNIAFGAHAIALDPPAIVGILNVTPDSFSDGGRFGGDAERAAGAGIAMAAEGAALIDVGGESTRPGAATVGEEEEIARVIPVIERLARAGVAVSIDTRKAAVMEAALAAGAGLVNDVSALLYDERAVGVVAKAGCPVVVMHYPGPPDDMHANADYRDPVSEVNAWLEERINALAAGGIAREKIIVDPGIGFGKEARHNLALIEGLARFHDLGCPVMLGASRKRMIGALSGDAAADQRLGGSIALALAGAERGAQFLRVHDVAETVQAVRIWRTVRDAGT